MPLPFDELLRAAHDRGIVSAEQVTSLRELAAELGGTTGVAAREDAPRTAATKRAEAGRGFNAITVAYALGAMLVLFAFGWFLWDRWEALGPIGVLAVSLTYTALLVGTGVYLRRSGFDTAGGIATTLAVGMTPVTAWALLALAGQWPDASSGDAVLRYPPWRSARRLVLELATIGAALVALRRVHFFGLGAPIAIALTMLGFDLAGAFADPEISWFFEPWYAMVVGTGILALAYLIDRRQPDDEDLAVWFYVAGLVAAGAGYVQLWGRVDEWRHLLPVLSVLLIVVSLYLRRRVLLAFGGIGVFWYLGYLAFDVFRRVLNFPVVLATFGLVVILGTVWLQRRYPALVERVNEGRPTSRPELPGGAIAALAPLIISTALLLAQIPEAKDAIEQRRFSERLHLLRRKRAAPTRVPQPLPATPPPERSAAPPRS